MRKQAQESRRRDQPAGPPTFTGFAVRLIIYLFVASLFFSLAGLHKRMGPIQNSMARIVSATANAIGGGARVEGSIIHTGQSALEINHECTGVFVLFVYASFVLAYPAPWSWRARGLIVGAAVLTAINIGRLILLVLVANRRPGWFAYLHEYFFQGVFIAILAFLASVWTEQVRRATIGRVSR